MGRSSPPNKAKLCRRTEAILAVIRGNQSVLAFAGKDVQRSYLSVCLAWFRFGRPAGFALTEAHSKGVVAITSAIAAAASSHRLDCGAHVAEGAE